MELTRNNIEIFAARNYLNEHCLDKEEFDEDFKRFVSIRKMVNRIRRDKPSNIRLLCNHILCTTNVFELQAVKKILMFDTTEEEKEILKTILNYFNFVAPHEMLDIKFSLKAAKLLKEMDR